MTDGELREIIERYDTDYERARALIEAAEAANSEPTLNAFTILVLSVVAIIAAIIIISGIRQWIKNNNSPIVTHPARIVDKHIAHGRYLSKYYVQGTRYKGFELES